MSVKITATPRSLIVDTTSFYVLFWTQKANNSSFWRYEGDVVDKATAEDANYVVVLNKEDSLPDFVSQSATKMTHDQVWECIKNKAFILN